MRLTLRTLLAYRDRVLIAADSEDLHRRIQQSHDAGNLLRRIGALTKQNQVFAPPVLGKGLGGDPNSIAEYLDDVLPHAQIPELERVCLVSDVQLAELADCHELLATAMHTKVAVPAELRSIALAIGQPAQRSLIAAQIQQRRTPRRVSKTQEENRRIDPAHASDNGADASEENGSRVPVTVKAPMLASGGESIKTQGLNLETSTLTHEVPEYLVGSSSGSWRLPLAIGALLAMLAVLVWQTLGPWEQVAGLFVRPTAATKRSTGPAAVAVAKASDATNAADTKDASANSEDNTSGNTTTVGDISESLQSPPGLPSSALVEPNVSSAEPKTVAEIDASPFASGIQRTGDIDAVSDTSISAGLASAVLPSGVNAGDIDAAGPDAGAGVSAAVENPTADASPASPELPSGDAAAEPTTEPSNSATAELAVWLPTDAREQRSVILIQQNGQTARLSAGQTLQIPVQQLVITPSMPKTTLDLPGGVLWKTGGVSLLGLELADDGSSLVRTSLCRGVVRGGPDGRKLRLKTPLGEHLVELIGANSQASVEVAYRPQRHGAALDRDSLVPVLIIFVVDGQISVQPTGALPPTAPLTMEIGEGIAFVAGENGRKFQVKSIPNWLYDNVERPIDLLAAEDLDRALNTADSDAIGQAIADLADSRKPETAALAVQTAMLTGNWARFAQGFFDSERMRSHWNPTINLARQLIAADPKRAQALQELMVAGQGELGRENFELLSGLPHEKVMGEGIGGLVQQLDSTRLDQRVLAAYQLQRLTGKNLGYLPYAPSRTSIQQWRRDLGTGRLSLASVPDVIWERQ